jgi:hypothetical protein
MMVSAWIAAEEAAPLDPIASVTLESLDDRVKDDDVSKELLDVSSVDELDCAASEELDSSTVLLSPPSGPELLASSPQAAKNKATADAKSKHILFVDSMLNPAFVILVLKSIYNKKF